MPVLTCADEVSFSRFVSLLIHALGMQELVTTGLEQYQKLAIELANDKKTLKVLRDKIKAARYIAPLFNIALTVRHIESVYQLIWRHYQAGLSPDVLNVEEVRH